MDKTLFTLGAASAFVGVSLGAFAAHLLKDKLPSDMFNVFEVAVRYQMYHALALLVSAFAVNWLGNYATIAGWLFVAGTLVFSGSLYVLSCSGQKWLGAITPVGGLLFLAGWAFLFIGAIGAVKK
jgi:uncharacterized membrane protein YgdD (TMEM256/DUF423 family)